MRLRLLLGCLLSIFTGLGFGQSLDRSLYQELQWRCIGPFRGGRTVGAAGVPSQPNTFYIGVNNGGVWKTTDFGQTWKPIFDDQPTGSIGTLAVAPSDPNTVYVCSGEGLQRPDLSVGDGIYRSRDAGKTWTHLGLKDGQQIGGIAIDPQNPLRLVVAVLGHPYGPNEERGVFLSNDGGDNWKKILYKDENTGAIAVAFDPQDSQTLYADLWAARQGPWENGGWEGDQSGLFKSIDGGATWNKCKTGLPERVGRIGFSISPKNPKRIYALVDADKGGLYRSEDAGQTWSLMDNESRIWGRGSDFAEVRVDPVDPDTVYIANTCSYKSVDGGKSFVAWKGAPGGDDYHTIWINPNDPHIICLASDQGATITVNGGDTWSSWYNQPTAQFYHVITDNQIPYWVYGGQQESGSVGISSRGNDGEITFRDWHPVGAEEYGYIAPDPLDPNTIFGGKLSKFDRITGQAQDVSPAARRGGDYRFLRTAPVVFSPVNPRVLYYAGDVVFKSLDRGQSWQVISPDLTREHPEIPTSVGVYTPQVPTNMKRRGVVYALGPSYKDANVLWAGTDDGYVHLSRDGGKTWSNITPPDLTSWSKVSIIDPGHFDTETAYIAVNRFRLDDLRPHIYRTHNSGKDWTEIVGGLPADAPVNTVREDSERHGLLYCGTERAAFFSVDDGDHWNPLRQNMPATSVRDLVVHENDLVVGTHGRSFWIMDDIGALRELHADQASMLFKPAKTYRFRRDTNSDTPLPPEESAGKNPPDGAILDYYVSPSDSGPVSLDILDETNHLVRRYSSDDQLQVVDPKKLQVPTYWIRPAQQLSAAPGMHRFIWNMYYQPLPAAPGFPISAVYMDTPTDPSSPLAVPGHYKVRLTVGSKTFEQPLLLLADPRIKDSKALQEEFNLAFACYQQAQALSASKNPADQRRMQAFMGLMRDVDGADAPPTATMRGQYGALTHPEHQQP
jgi:photosystem II stability/assembly factor-like uncharacterized protein